jgi:hypothetical protein
MCFLLCALGCLVVKSLHDQHFTKQLGQTERVF